MKELTERVILIDRDAGGKKRERYWEEISSQEKARLAVLLEDNAMQAAGYRRIDGLTAMDAKEK